MYHISPPKQMESFVLLHFLIVPLSSLILPDLCRLGWGCRMPATGTGWSQAGRGSPPGPSCTPWRAQCASSLWAAAPRSTESSRRGARTWNLRGVHPTRSAPWSERRVWKCCDLKAFRLSWLRHGHSKSPFSRQKKNKPLHPSQNCEDLLQYYTHLWSNYVSMQIKNDGLYGTSLGSFIFSRMFSVYEMSKT